jgi:hypothetical protein
MSPPLVTRNVKGYVPAVVATPMRPALALDEKDEGKSVRSKIPGGSEPVGIDQTYVLLAPPVALNGSSTRPMLIVGKVEHNDGISGSLADVSEKSSFVGIPKFTTALEGLFRLDGAAARISP